MLSVDAREMLWWMTTASSSSRTAVVTVSLVSSLKRSQTGSAQRRMSRSALADLASSTSPKPSLYFSVAASCSTSPRSRNVVSSRKAVDLWMSSSLATSVTPDHPRRDNNSITEMALSTDCTGGLLRATAHISADPTPPSVSWPDPPVSRVWTTGRSTSWACCYQNVLMSSFLEKERGRPSGCSAGWLDRGPVACRLSRSRRKREMWWRVECGSGGGG